jgi:hypothetical protein
MALPPPPSAMAGVAVDVSCRDLVAQDSLGRTWPQLKWHRTKSKATPVEEKSPKNGQRGGVEQQKK